MQIESIHAAVSEGAGASAPSGAAVAGGAASGGAGRPSFGQLLDEANAASAAGTPAGTGADGAAETAKPGSVGKEAAQAARHALKTAKHAARDAEPAAASAGAAVQAGAAAVPHGFGAMHALPHWGAADPTAGVSNSADASSLGGAVGAKNAVGPAVALTRS